MQEGEGECVRRRVERVEQEVNIVGQGGRGGGVERICRERGDCEKKLMILLHVVFKKNRDFQNI